MVNPGVLAGRIQGFGNVNPPPLEEENAKSIAKRVTKNLGAMVGEELVLTVQDFREKGAVSAVKDAVFDAGDILIDGVSSVFGWLRGDPPLEEDDNEKTEAAQSALTNAPRGAAYGISQASPTGGINAVWVMPEEADPATMAQLAAQQAPSGIQPYQPYSGIPAGIQPYQPHSNIPAGIQPYQPQGSRQMPGGPVIAPYQLAGARGRGAPPPFAFAGASSPSSSSFVPGAMPGAMAGYGGAGGFHQAPSAPVGGVGLVKSLVEKVASGESIPGPELARRLVSTCSGTQVSAAQLSESIAERVRRTYLGLDGGADADGALARLLALADALAQQDGLGQSTAKLLAGSVSEELMSLQSSAKHRAVAGPMLRRLGLLKAPAAETVDLLGGGGGAAASAAAGGQADLLDMGGPGPASTSNDLLAF